MELRFSIQFVRERRQIGAYKNKNKMGKVS